MRSIGRRFYPSGNYRPRFSHQISVYRETVVVAPSLVFRRNGTTQIDPWSCFPLTSAPSQHMSWAFPTRGDSFLRWRTGGQERAALCHIIEWPLEGSTFPEEVNFLWFKFSLFTQHLHLNAHRSLGVSLPQLKTPTFSISIVSPFSQLLTSELEWVGASQVAKW